MFIVIGYVLYGNVRVCTPYLFLVTYTTPDF
jgi:hypothetical protein